MKLMIVESPNKIKKIQTYLGPDWTVAASVGHIRDLPDKEMGVSPPDFKPQYVVSPDKKAVVSKLKTLVSKASEVYLATDPDREGEAISYHLKVALGLKTHKRVTFNEITKTAISTAIATARQIDYKMVAAQEARRVLDRLFGYTLSPILSQQAGIRLSAGRVQSVAVKIVVLRENEIKDFRKRNFYILQAKLSTGLTLELQPKTFAEDGKHIFDLALIKSLQEQTQQLYIKSVKTEPKTINPRPPFTTSTLQQAASSALKMSPADTMKNAQCLFEQGAITYHRTDSPNLSADGFNTACKALQALNLPHQTTQIKYASKASAQEAHEAIRPTAFDETAGETPAQQQLYKLILERTLTSAMPAGIDDVTVVTATIANGHDDNASKAVFVASGKIVAEQGWRKLACLEPYQAKEQVLDGEATEGQVYDCSTGVITKQTEPPSRFTEASLIKALEALGIGRPSTYAAIMENIKQRDYISIAKKGTAVITPTPTGEAVVLALEAMPFMNLSYTAQMEEQLDLISHGKAAYQYTVASAFSDLESQLGTIKIPLLVGTCPCPLCGEPVKRLKNQNGFFWVHVDEHAANDCTKFLPDTKGTPAAPVQVQRITKECTKCGKELLQRTNKENANKKFWVHTIDNPDCDKYQAD